MKSVKKTLLITAGMAILAGLLLLGLSCSKYGFPRSAWGAAITNSYPVDGSFDSILIEVEITNVEFKPSEDGSCRLVCQETEKLRHITQIEKGVLKIRAEDLRQWYEKIGFFTTDFENVSATLYLPQQDYQKLSVRTATGSLSLPEKLKFKAIDAESATGKLSLRGLEAGELKLSTDIGSIELLELSVSGTLRAESSTGTIRLEGTRCAELQLDSSTGNVLLENSESSGKMQIKTSTGDVRFAQSGAAEIEVESGTGDVSGTLSSEMIFSADSSTGRVSVPRSNSGGACRISTGTGDIQIESAGSARP